MEFQPKHPRACNVISFSPTSNLIASVFIFNYSKGLDKVRNDYCLAIWDLMHSDKPIIQCGPSEAVSSIAWMKDNHFIAGMGKQKFYRKGNKWVRMYDGRLDNVTPSIVIPTRAVNGIMIDPFNPYRIVSYTDESELYFWDIRTHNHPLFSLNVTNSNASLSKIMYSQRRKGLIGSLSKDNNCIAIWDFHDTKKETDSVEIDVPVLFKSKESNYLNDISKEIHTTSCIL